MCGRCLRRRFMCENLKYWMRLYMARVIKGGLVVVATGFLFFQCSFLSSGEDPVAEDPSNVADSDGDGLIEIKDATMLNNMRYNLAGTSYKTSADDAGDANGCPASGCNGYELTADIDLLNLLDTNNNGIIDTTTVSVAGKTHMVIDTGVGKDTSWMPIGDGSKDGRSRFSRSQFTGTFEGNNYTIANLWVNISSSSNAYAGLFGFVSGPSVEIRNLGIIFGSVHSSSSASSRSGGLVGYSFRSLTITNSYFSGVGGISSSSSSSSSRSGGLVGYSNGDLTITNSYFSGVGGVSSSSSSTTTTLLDPSWSYSGGLVGHAFGSLMTIMNSYFSGVGGISSSAVASASHSGGLVGSSSASSFTITNSYFSGGGSASSSSSSSRSGGLVGEAFNPLTIINSYWNTDAPQSVNGMPQNPKRAQGDASSNPAGTTSLTLMQLKATSGMYPDSLLLPAPGIGDAWDLGTDMQLPAIKTCVNPTIVPPMMTGGNITVTCASYGDLLAGQR